MSLPIFKFNRLKVNCPKILSIRIEVIIISVIIPENKICQVSIYSVIVIWKKMPGPVLRGGQNNKIPVPISQKEKWNKIK